MNRQVIFNVALEQQMPHADNPRRQALDLPVRAGQLPHGAQGKGFYFIDSFEQFHGRTSVRGWS